jgi:hypothetical protein
MRKAALLTFTAALALSGCNRGPEAEKLPEDNVTEVVNATENANVVVAPPAVNASNASNTTAKAAPAPGFTDDAQMRDDADATGMTARLPDEAPASGNETAPVK